MTQTIEVRHTSNWSGPSTSEKARLMGPWGAHTYHEAPGAVWASVRPNVADRSARRAGRSRASPAMPLFPFPRASDEETPRVPVRLATATP